MRVIQTETGHLRFSDDDSRWPLVALTAGALGLCAVALGGCAVDGAPGEASDPILICGTCHDPSLIVYSLDNIMHVVHGDGSGDHNLGIVGFHPSLSHDRSRIVFVAGDGKLWMANVDGSNLTQVTAGSTAEYDPSFGPDDTELVFTSASSADYGMGLDVYLTSASSQLTRVGQWRKLTSAGSFRASSPKLSADGTHVVFQPGRYDDISGAAALVQVDAALTNQAPSSWIYLTTPTFGLKHVDTDDGTPDLSADGATIVYVHDHAGYHNIYTMTAAGTHKAALTSGNQHDDSPAWGPNDRIVFSSNRQYQVCSNGLCGPKEGDGSQTNLFAMNADGSGLVSLTGTTGQALTPSWQ